MRFRLDWPLLAWLVWGGATLGIAVLAYGFPFAHTVHDVYVLASRRWWLGEDMYTVIIEHYRYSPLFAILMTPFAWLPDGLGSATWKAFNIGVFCLGLRAMAGRLLPRPWSPKQTAGLFLLAFPLVMNSAYNGQANLIMLAACLFGLAAAAERRWTGAAVWLALATLIKGYPLALALLVLALYPRPFAWRFLLALGSGLLLPFAAQRPSVVTMQYASWYHHLGECTSIMRERLRTLDHLLQVYGYPISPRTFALMGLVGGLLVLGWCLRHARCHPEPRQRLTWVFLCFALWTVLVGPATESCTYAVMGPAIAWVLLDAFARPTPTWTRALLIISLVLMGPIVTDLGGPLRNLANSHGSQPIGALLFLGYLLTRRGKMREQGEGRGIYNDPQSQARRRVFEPAGY